MSSTAASGALVAGIDVGTQGVRVLVLDTDGGLRMQATKSLPRAAARAPGIVEQDAEAWWHAVSRCLRLVTSEVDAARIAGIGVTSTSGTIVLVGDDDRPLRPALMYDDARAVSEARELAAALPGLRVRASDPPAKLLWLSRHEPAAFARLRCIAHAADFIVARLTGEWATDWSHALKSGYDPERLRWSSILEAATVEEDLFPPVVAPRTKLGVIRKAAAKTTGLDTRTPVFAAMTDGCTSQIAAGAVSPGKWSTTIATTLVVKGVTRERLRDPIGRCYCHRHPDGFWMPGGASNTGGDCLEREFAGQDFAALDRLAAKLTPSGLVCYPLMQTGERFPFDAPQARGFLDGTVESEAQRFAAHLEGVAFLERLAYETLDEIGAEVDGTIATAGGGARSATSGCRSAATSSSASSAARCSRKRPAAPRSSRPRR